MDDCKASCDGHWIYPKRFSRSRSCKNDNKFQESCNRDNREDSKLRGSSRQNFYLPLAEEEEEEEESLGSLVVKKKKKKKRKKRKLDGGAASNFFVAASNFFEEPLKASGGERKSMNMSRCETGTEKGENGGGM